VPRAACPGTGDGWSALSSGPAESVRMVGVQPTGLLFTRLLPTSGSVMGIL